MVTAFHLFVPATLCLWRQYWIHRGNYLNRSFLVRQQCGGEQIVHLAPFCFLVFVASKKCLSNIIWSCRPEIQIPKQVVLFNLHLVALDGFSLE